jgi:methionyl-tRNA synthetase
VLRANSDLANSFGNLAQRTLSFIAKNLEGRLPQGEQADVDAELLVTVMTACEKEVPRALDQMAPSVALEAWMRAVFACNAYIDAQAPWVLRKTDPARMEAVLATLYVAIGQLAIAIRPIIPASADALLDQMGVPAEGRTYQALSGDWYVRLSESGFTPRARPSRSSPVWNFRPTKPLLPHDRQPLPPQL